MSEPWSIEELIAEAERTVQEREKHHGRLVSQRKLTRAEADERLSKMRAIARRLTRTAAV